MKVTTETVATREVELTIEPDPAVVQRAMRRAARQISRVRPVAGYRPGRAPYGMVERIYGRDLILDQAVNDMAQQVYREAVEEAEIEPLQPGEFDVDSREPLVLKARVPLVPTVTLGDYASLHVDPEPEIAIAEEQIDEQLETVRRRHAEHVPVERAVEIGDQVVATLKGTVDDDPVVDEENATLNISDDMTPPGFGEALVGMGAGGSRQFSLTYPEDYEDTNLAGKNADFDVTINTVREVILPEPDDDLAKMAGDLETLDDLRQSLAEQLEARLTAEARDRETTAAVEAVVEQAEVEYPEAAVETEVDREIENQKARLSQMGFEYEAYLRMVGQTEAQVRDQVRPDAIRRLVQRLVVMEFAKAEEISLSNDEMTGQLSSYVGRMAAAYGETPETVMERLSSGGAIPSLYLDALTGKAVRNLTAMLTGRPIEEDEGEQAEAGGEAIESADTEGAAEAEDEQTETAPDAPESVAEQEDESDDE